MRGVMAVGAGALLMVLLGGVYAWSAFVPALRAQFGYTAAQTQFVFGAVIAVLSVFSLLTGPLQDRLGPRPLAATSAVLLACGYLGAGFLGGTFPGLVLTIGVTNGAAVACGYMCAIATAARWFPARRGLAVGVVSAGYGLGAVLLAAIARALEARGWGPLETFRFVGCAYGPAAFLCAMAMVAPPAPAIAGTKTGAAPAPALLSDRRFLALSAGICCGTFPGLALIGNLKPMALAHGLDALQGTLAISVLAAGSAAGRVAWGLAHDRLGGRPVTLLSLSLVLASGLPFLAGRTPAAVFLASAFFLGFCYGGGLSIYAAQAARAGGAEVLGRVYSRIFLAHGAAALAAPLLAGLGLDLTGSYLPAVLMSLAAAGAGLVAYALLMPAAPPKR